MIATTANNSCQIVLRREFEMHVLGFRSLEQFEPNSGRPRNDGCQTGAIYGRLEQYRALDDGGQRMKGALTIL